MQKALDNRLKQRMTYIYCEYITVIHVDLREQKVKSLIHFS